MSTDEIVRGAPQGDPRWFMMIFGDDVAGYFGFRLMRGPDGHTRLVVPGAARLTRAIDAVNALLPKSARIPLRFYASDPKEPEVNADRFQRKFATERLYPIAEGDALMLHDISFHSAAIICPPEILEEAAHRSRLLRDYGSRLMTAAHGTTSEALAIEFARYLTTDDVESLDVGLGNVGSTLSDGDTSFMSYDEGYLTLTSRAQSTEAFLDLRLIRALVLQKRAPGYEAFVALEKQVRATFFAEQKNADPAFDENTVWAEDRYMHELALRRALITEAVRRLRARPNRP